MREFATQSPVFMQARGDGLQPCADVGLFLPKPAAVWSQPFQAGQAAQSQQAQHRMAANLQGPSQGLKTFRQSLVVPAQQWRGQSIRQQRGQFGHAWFEMVVDPQQLTGLKLHLGGHALPTAGAAFQIRHPHDVVKRHPQGQPARGVAAGRVALHMRGVGGVFGIQHRLQTRYIQVGIGRALVVQQTLVTQLREFAHCGGQGLHCRRGRNACGGHVNQGGLRAVIVLQHGLQGLGIRCTFKARRETFQAGLGLRC